MEKEAETVTILKSEYESLLRDAKLLMALENGGVDNWEWYGEAYREAFGGDEDEEED